MTVKSQIVLPLLALAGIACLHAQTTGADKAGTVEKIKVHGTSLEGNLEGDSADRDVFLYLPPSYASQPNRRYPVA